ncbi:protein arginine N-methyltransferase 1 [Drosophila tropicalis]|uniref:protein arginine N-methyltransferase 1 n=1 Tax=Drosophila tropicalis TaxID=46794 RepID=UPI0035AC187A
MKIDSDMESDLNCNRDMNISNAILNDPISCKAYHELFQTHNDLFKDKIVLDVGCRSGMLSLMAVEVGAIKVIATGNMESADFVEKALSGSEKKDIFESIKGSIEQIRLPYGLKKVDIIVSEWMGHAIFTESLYRDVIYARDKWLDKGGLIIPNVATLFMAGMTKNVPKNTQEDEEDTEDEMLLEDYVTPDQLMTHRFRLKIINLSVAIKEDEYFQSPFGLNALRDGEIQGLVLHFDVAFAHNNIRMPLFSIGPRKPKTYLKQTLIYLEDNLMVQKHEMIEGYIAMFANKSAVRGVEFVLGMKTINDEELSE